MERNDNDNLGYNKLIESNYVEDGTNHEKKSRAGRKISDISEGSYNPKKTIRTPIQDCVKEKKIRWFTLIGSAIIISIACIDPGNLQGDIQAAQEMRYKSIWVLLFSHILLYLFQEMSLMVAVFSNKDLAQLIRLNFSPFFSYFIWICSEIAIIAADIQEMLGASVALNILLGISLIPSSFIVVAIVLLVLFIQEIGQKLLEVVFLVLVALLGISFLIMFGLIDKNFGDIMFGFVPNLPKDLSFTAIIGSIIMPQNLFLHASLVLTRNTKKNPSFASKVFKIETGFVLFLSFLINFFIVGVFANEIFVDKDISLENAGEFLKLKLPAFSSLLWGMGLLASGVSSTASGALTGQYLMNGIFNMKVSKLKRVLVTRTITLIPCLLFIIFVDINKIMNILNIIQFVQLPFVVVPLIKFATNVSIMERNVYKGFKLWFLILFSFVLQAINVYSIFGVVEDIVGEPIWWLVLVLIVIQTGFILYLSLIKIKGEKHEEMTIFEEDDEGKEEKENEPKAAFNPNEDLQQNNKDQKYDIDKFESNNFNFSHIPKDAENI